MWIGLASGALGIFGLYQFKKRFLFQNSEITKS